MLRNVLFIIFFIFMSNVYAKDHDPLYGASVYEGKGEAHLPDNSVYRGKFKNGLFHGKGKIDWANGSSYEGEFVDGFGHGKGKINFSDGSIYEGDIYKGLMHGNGKYKCISGNTYVGNFVKGLISGKGEMTYYSGARYVGEFLMGHMHGKGKIEWSEGSWYEGDYNNDRREGKGRLVTADGATYVGNFVKDMYEGSGILENNYMIYEGNFKAGHASGFGKMTFKNNGMVYEGEFKGFVPTGNFTVTAKEGTKCVGEVVDGTLNGKGKCEYTDGSKYEGQLANNYPNGKGTMHYSTGETVHGVWKGFELVHSIDINATKELAIANDFAELEREVAEIIKLPNTSMRPKIHKVFNLADIYIGKKEYSNASRLLEIALEVDSWRLDYQLKLASLYVDNKEYDKVAEKAQRVYEYSEEQSLIEQALVLLSLVNVNIERTIDENVFDGLEIRLVKIGNVNRYLIVDLAIELQNQLGIKVSIYEPSITEQELPSLEPLDADAILNKMNEKYSWHGVKRKVVYLGVTKRDIRTSDTSFIFGKTGWGNGIISYHRFMSEFNGDNENRKKLLVRTLKQAMSTSFFLFDIPRGNEAMSVRAYAHNLQEHDNKPLDVDKWTQDKFDALKKRYGQKG